MRVRSQAALVLSLILAGALSPEASGQSVAGCYDVEIGEWTPPPSGGDSLYFAPPSRVVLDTLSVPNFRRGYSILRVAPGALPSIHPLSGWVSQGDSIRLEWSRNLNGLTAVVGEVPGGYRGEARSVWHCFREVRTASFGLRKATCDSRPPVVLQDQRPLAPPISISDGPRMELMKAFTPGPEWKPRELEELAATVYSLNDVQVQSLGLARSIEVTVSGNRDLHPINIHLASDFDFDASVLRLTDELGPPTGGWDFSDRNGRRTMGAVWENRTVNLTIGASEEPDGSWDSWFTLRTQGYPWPLWR